MADYGREYTDRELADLERRIAKQYGIALKSVREKLKKVLSHFSKQDEEMKNRFEKGDITEKEWIEWREKTILNSREYHDFLNDVASDFVMIDKQVIEMVGVACGTLWLFNRNWSRFAIQKDSGYNLSFKPLKSQNKAKKGVKKVNTAKAMKWNRDVIHSVVYNSMKQGKSIPQIATDLEMATGRTSSATIRIARTTVTEIENDARYESMVEAREKGLDIRKRWLATLDQRTRTSHRHLNGVVIDVKDRFENKLLYPGDPEGKPAERINCRCCLQWHIVSHTYYDDQWSRLPAGMTYDEWLNAKPVYKPRRKKRCDIQNKI